MRITSETCRADSVIKTAQNNLHQAGPNKTHTFIVLTYQSRTNIVWTLTNIPCASSQEIYVFAPMHVLGDLSISYLS